MVLLFFVVLLTEDSLFCTNSATFFYKNSVQAVVFPQKFANSGMMNTFE